MEHAKWIKIYQKAWNKVESMPREVKSVGLGVQNA